MRKSQKGANLMDGKLRLSIVAVFAFACSSAFGLGLGDIDVKSKLNQPLDAEIELINVSESLLEGATATLASEADFTRVGLERVSSLENLQFGFESRSDGSSVIHVTSVAAVREPFLNFLIEVEWEAGRILREYTLLLDPPVFAPTSQAVPEREQVAAFDESDYAAPVEAAEEPESVLSEPAAEISEPEMVTEAQVVEESTYQEEVAEQTYSASTEYGPVAAGDTLWEIAREMRPSKSIQINRMMIALLRSNPEAFFEDNINALKQGAILRIPDSDEIESLTLSEATEVVRAQNGLWQDYRSSLARHTPTVSDVGVGEESYASDYSVTDAYGDDESRLEIVPAGDEESDVAGLPAGSYTDSNGGASDELEEDLARAQEDLVARDQEASDLRSRVGELESLVDKLERAINIKDSDLAEMQVQLVAAREAIVALESTSDESSSVPLESQMESPGTTDVADGEIAGETFDDGEILDDGETLDGGEALEMVDSTDASADDGSDEAGQMVSGFEAEGAADDGEFVAAPGEFSFDDEPEDQSATAESAEEPIVVEPQPIEPSVSSPGYDFVGMLTSPLAMLAYLGVLVLGGAGWWWTRRRGGADELDSLAEQFAEVGDEGEVGLVDTDAADDAEETLLRGDIAGDPDNPSLRVALLKHLHAKGSAADFEGEAIALLHLIEDDTDREEWQEILPLGQAICPESVTFGGLGEMPTLEEAEFSAADVESALEDSAGEDDELDFDAFDFDDDEDVVSLDDVQETAEDQAEEPEEFEELEEPKEPKEPKESEEPEEFDLSNLYDEELVDGLGGVDSTADEKPDDELELEFQSALDEEVAGDVAEEVPLEEELEFDLDDALDEIEDQVSDLELEPGTAVGEDDLSEELDIGLEKDGEELDIDFGEDDGDLSDVEELTLDELDLDLDGSDLDLGDEDVAEEEAVDEQPAATEAEEAAEEKAEEIEDVLELETDDLFAGEDSVGTKIDLARAYLDMGDPDGAKGMLEEAIDEGTEEQRREAERLLGEL